MKAKVKRQKANDNDHRAEPSAKDKTGNAALKWAAEVRRAEISEWLRDAAAAWPKS
jgi:hypothetical protein